MDDEFFQIERAKKGRVGKGGAQSIRSPSHVILPVCARCATGVGENTKGKKKRRRRYDNGWHDMEGKASPRILYLPTLTALHFIACSEFDRFT